MAPGVEVLFLRPDGSQLAMWRSEILERSGPAEPWRQVEVAEGSRLYRRRRVLAVAEERGYIAADPAGAEQAPAPRSARGQLGGTRHKHVQVAVETPDVADGLRFRAQAIHGDGSWHSADDLPRALSSAIGVPAEDQDLLALADRVGAKLAPDSRGA